MTVAARSPGGLSPRILFGFILSILIWGSTWTAIRYQLGVTAPAWSIAFRFAMAALLLALYAGWRGMSLRIRAHDLPLIAIIGFAQFDLNFLFIYEAEHRIASGLVAMIFALLIVPNALFGRIFLGHRVGRGFVAGALLAILGMALLFADEIGALKGGAILPGIGFALLGTLFASIGNVLQSGPRVRHMNWAALLVWAMATGALLDAAGALALTGWPRLDPHPEYWLSTLYLALFGSAVTFPVYLAVMRAIGPGRAAYSGVAVPIVAMALSTLLEGYRWTPTAIAGAAIAMAGLVIALRGRTATDQSSSSARSPAR